MSESTYKDSAPSPTGPIKQTHGFGAAIGGAKIVYRDGPATEVTLSGPSNVALGKKGQSEGVATKGFGKEIR